MQLDHFLRFAYAKRLWIIPFAFVISLYDFGSIALHLRVIEQLFAPDCEATFSAMGE
jgi:hypothetical protein